MEDEIDAVQDLPPIRTQEEFTQRLERLAICKEIVEETEADLKSAKAQEAALSANLAAYMLAGEIKSIVVGTHTFTQKQKVFSKVEDKEALRAWIADNDAVDLLMAVHPSKLTAYCNEQLEAGGETPIGVNPNFIKYYVHIK